MGKRGPKPKSEKDKKLHGTYRKDRKKNRPAKKVFRIGCPDKPDFLTGLASKFWDNWAPELVKQGILTPLDMAIFTGLCQSYADYVMACQEVNKLDDKFLKTSQGNVKPHPWIEVKNKSFNNFVQCAKEMGLTPASRIETIKPGDIENPFKYFLKKDKDED